MAGFNLDDYVTVAERVEQFYAKFPDGSLQAEVLELNESRVVMRASAYRNPDDPRPAIAHSMLTIPGKTPYTRDSEVENAETSAIGRAIALLGFEVKKSLASRNELEAKGATSEARDGLVGTVVKQKAMTTDFLVRQSPDGPFLGFRLANGAGAGVICEVRGDLAPALAVMEEQVVGQRVQVWGEFVEYKPPTVKHPYRAFRVSRLATPTFTIPAEGAQGQPPEAEVAPEPPMGVEEDAPDEPVLATDGAEGSSSTGSPQSPEPDICGAPSPFGDDGACTLLRNHRGHHKNLEAVFPTTWGDAA